MVICHLQLACIVPLPGSPFRWCFGVWGSTFGG